MTQDEAYLAGFCKAAEVAGIDPEVLYKRAQLKARIGAWLAQGLAQAAKAKQTVAGAAGAATAAAKKGGKRYLELLRGGNQAAFADLNRGAAFDGALANAGAFLGQSPAQVSRAAQIEKVLAPIKRRLNALAGRTGVDRAAVTEARKSLGAQLGTAGAVGGAGYGVGRAVSGGDNK